MEKREAEVIKALKGKMVFDATEKIQTLEWFQARQKGITSTGATIAMHNYLHKCPEEVKYLPPFWVPVSYIDEKTGDIVCPDPLDYGLLPFGNTSYSYYLDKITPITELPERKSRADSFRMDCGSALEPLVRDLYEEASGHEIVKPEAILQHPKYEFILDEPDGIIVPKNGAMRCYEGKITNALNLTGSWMPGEYGNGGLLPPYYFVQACQHMLVTGLEYCTVVCCYGFNTGNMCIVQIERDPDFEALLIRAEQDFWENHVLAKIPPEGGMNPKELPAFKKRAWANGLKTETKVLPDEARPILAAYYRQKAEAEDIAMRAKRANTDVLYKTAELFECETPEELSETLKELKVLEATRTAANNEEDDINKALTRTLTEIMETTGTITEGVLPLCEEMEVVVANSIESRSTVDTKKAKLLLQDIGYPEEEYMKESCSFKTLVKTRKPKKPKEGKSKKK